jgi:hypothetical protein
MDYKSAVQRTSSKKMQRRYLAGCEPLPEVLTRSPRAGDSLRLEGALCWPWLEPHRMWLPSSPAVLPCRERDGAVCNPESLLALCTHRKKLQFSKPMPIFNTQVIGDT